MNKKILIILFFALFLVLSPALIMAADLENKYPTIPGVTTPTTTEEPLVTYLLYIYQISIAISGFIIFVSFLIGGWKYLFSVGNPSKKLDGRQRIQGALLGFVIVLGSYIILNTISPGLTVFPDFILEDINMGQTQQSALEDILGEQYLKELPLGALITSEYSASIFLDDTTATDTAIKNDDVESYKKYISAFPSIKEYNSGFQGALHGRRLKRIWEVASSTNGMTTVMDKIADDLKQSIYQAEGKLTLLSTLAATCSCAKCKNLLCMDPIAPICPCILCNNMLDPCGVIERLIMEDIQTDVPKLYEGYDSESPSSLIPCKTLELEYASKILLNFATQDKYINSKDAGDKNFIGSDDQKKMEEALKNCGEQNLGTWDTTIKEKLDGVLNQIISAISNTLGDIFETKDTSKRDDFYSKLNNSQYYKDMQGFLQQNAGGETISGTVAEIEEWRDLLAITENEGNWDPTSTIPERDVASNFNDLQSIYDALLEVKNIMNPYGEEFQSMELATYLQLEMIKNSTQVYDPDQMPTSMKDEGKIIVAPYKILFGNSLSSISEKEITKYSQDPATFYYDDPDHAVGESISYNPIGNFLMNLFSKFFKVDIASAAEDTNPLTEGLEDVDKTECTPLVEIPIGDATDEALNLIKDILDQLKTMKDNITNLPDEIKQLKDDEKSFYEAANKLIEKTDGCKSSCLATCSCTCGIPVIAVVCESCGCACIKNTAEPICPGLVDAAAEAVKAAVTLDLTLKEVTDDIDEMIVAFKRLNSEDVKDQTKDDEYLGTSMCCVNKEGDGDCRDDSDDSKYVNIEERKYTLKEQLVRVQLLLNRSREIGFSASESDDNKSDYAILLKGLQNIDKKMDSHYFDMAYGTNDFVLDTENDGTVSMLDVAANAIGGGIGIDVTNLEGQASTANNYISLENRYLSDLSDCGYIYETTDQFDEDRQNQSLAVLLDSELAKGEFIDDFTKLLDPDASESCTPDPLLDCYYFARYMKKATDGDDAKSSKREKMPFHCYIYNKDLEFIDFPKGTRIPEGGNLANNMYCCIVGQQPEKEL